MNCFKRNFGLALGRNAKTQIGGIELGAKNGSIIYGAA